MKLKGDISVGVLEKCGGIEGWSGRSWNWLGLKVEFLFYEILGHVWQMKWFGGIFLSLSLFRIVKVKNFGLTRFMVLWSLGKGGFLGGVGRPLCLLQFTLVCGWRSQCGSISKGEVWGRITSLMRGFNKFIEESGLFDPPLVESNFN